MEAFYSTVMAYIWVYLYQILFNRCVVITYCYGLLVYDYFYLIMFDMFQFHVFANFVIFILPKVYAITFSLNASKVQHRPSISNGIDVPELTLNSLGDN